MDRRESLKSLFVGALATGAVVSGCQTETTDPKQTPTPERTARSYGRTAEEKIRDQQLQATPDFFTAEELATIGILADIILPADDVSGSATDAGVVEFINYIVKEMTQNQTPMRSGLGWMDRESNNRYEKPFRELTNDQQIAIVEDIAYPDEAEGHLKAGANFFSLARNMVLTGFYTSELGVKDIGYIGNMPNFWNGVPEEVLAKHGFEHDEELLAKYITEEQRYKVAQWDEEGNLV